jgi:UDP-N-acetylmuramate dehydrogenase
MYSLYTTLKQFGHVRINEPLSKHTTFKIGGPADCFLTLEETSKIVEVLKYLDGEGIPYFILGGGSNMLVSDEGFRGVVLNFKNQKYTISGDTVEADAGCSTVEIARKSIQAALTGFEWGVGVPGTLGGAVRGNAGAMGGEMKDSVETVHVYQNGEVIELHNQECEFGYRNSIFKSNGGIVLGVTLKLQPVSPERAAEGMKRALENLQYRNKTQPQGFASTGCVFKNFEIEPKHVETLKEKNIPEEFFAKGKISAGYLIDQSGMKGVQVGQAKVSETHGNFVVNLGGATASDVLSLIEQIQERVYDRFQIEIEPEIQII